MSVSAVLTGQDVYRFFLGSSNKNKYAEQSTQEDNAQAKTIDTVQISEEAKKLAKERETEEFIKGLEAEVELPALPPEVMEYALPKWFADLTPSQFIISLNSGVDTREEPSPEAREYNETRWSIYRDEIKKHREENGLDREKNNESIRKAVLKRLKEDKRMCQLMNFLGIKMPATEK